MPWNPHGRRCHGFHASQSSWSASEEEGARPSPRSGGRSHPTVLPVRPGSLRYAARREGGARGEGAAGAEDDARELLDAPEGLAQVAEAMGTKRRGRDLM